MYKYLVTYCWYREGTDRSMGMEYADTVVHGDPMEWFIEAKRKCKAMKEHLFLLNIEQLDSSEHVKALEELTTG